MFTRSFDRRVYLFVAVLLGAGAVGTSFAVYALWPANVEVGYQPLQPIAYSHKLHAGELQIDCRYCHHRADRDDHAGVPSIATCMKCHEEVQPKDSKGNLRPEIEKLLDAWEKKEPVQWVKVHDLADFVYFPHYRHTSWFNPETGRARSASPARNATVPSRRWRSCSARPR